MESKQDNPNTDDANISPLAVLAEAAEVAQSQFQSQNQSQSSQSSYSPLPDLIDEQNGGADCPCEDDDEMPELEDVQTTVL